MPPPTIMPPSQALPRICGESATTRPMPVSRIAAISDRTVSAILYPLGIPGENASMAMKCVAQMPKPRGRSGNRKPDVAQLIRSTCAHDAAASRP